MKKRISVLLALALTAAIAAPTAEAAGETLITNPGTQAIWSIDQYGGPVRLHIPVYSIVQPGAANGSNYVKLRDIANVIDFGVEWDASDPNTMRIYTYKHYDGTQLSAPPLGEIVTYTDHSGIPYINGVEVNRRSFFNDYIFVDGVCYRAASTYDSAPKAAVPSTMSIYIDDVLVNTGDLKIYLIDDQNYFAIRDLARLVNFSCYYITYNTDVPYIQLDPNKQYAPDTKTPSVKRVINYEDTATTFPKTYGAPSGEVLDAPHTVSPLDPMAREDYWNTYASAEAKAAFDRQLAKTNKLCYNVDEVNAIIQTLIDLPKIRALDGTPLVMSGGSRYPMNYVPAHYFLQDRDKSAYGLDTVMGWTHAPRFVDVTANASSGLTYFDARLYDSQRAFANASEVAPVLAKLEGKTTREQAVLILHAICDKFGYAQAGSNRPSPISDLGTMWSDGKVYSGVCADYENAMRYWFNLVGIPYFIEISDSHQWGEIYLVEEDKWVAVDATWADEGTKGGNFEKYAISDPAVHYQDVTKEPYPEDNDAAIVSREIMELGMKLRNK